MKKKSILLSFVAIIFSNFVIGQGNPPTKETNNNSTEKSNNNTDLPSNTCFLTFTLDYSNAEVFFDASKKIVGKLTVAEIKNFCSNRFEGEIISVADNNASFNVGLTGIGSKGSFKNTNICIKKCAIFYKLVTVRDDSSTKIMGSIILGFGYSLDINYVSKNKSGGLEYMTLASISGNKDKLNTKLSFSAYGLPINDSYRPTIPSIPKIDANSIQIGTSLLEKSGDLINTAISNDKITPHLTVIGFIPSKGISNQDMYNVILDINNPISKSDEPKNGNQINKKFSLY